MKKVIVYSRCSCDSVDALNAQVQECIQYASTKGYTVVRVIQQLNVPADGNAFNDIIDNINTDVVTMNITRIARSKAMQDTIVKNLEVKQCKLIFVN